MTSGRKTCSNGDQAEAHHVVCVGLLASLSYMEVLSNHCLATLNLGAGVEQPFDCCIIQNRQAVQSMRRSMDRTVKNNMVNCLFL